MTRVLALVLLMQPLGGCFFFFVPLPGSVLQAEMAKPVALKTPSSRVDVRP